MYGNDPKYHILIENMKYNKYNVCRLRDSSFIPVTENDITYRDLMRKNSRSK